MRATRGYQCRCPWCGRWSPPMLYNWLCSAWLRLHRHTKEDWLRVD